MKIFQDLKHFRFQVFSVECVKQTSLVSAVLTLQPYALSSSVSTRMLWSLLVPLPLQATVFCSSGSLTAPTNDQLPPVMSLQVCSLIRLSSMNLEMGFHHTQCPICDVLNTSHPAVNILHHCLCLPMAVVITQNQAPASDTC